MLACPADLAAKLSQCEARLFASWGVDYIKVDGCYEELKELRNLCLGRRPHGSFIAGHAERLSGLWRSFEQDGAAYSAVLSMIDVGLPQGSTCLRCTAAAGQLICPTTARAVMLA